jgi:predicted transposase YbfD/YdcC
VIIESGNAYVMGVKKNQPNLYKEIERITAGRKNTDSWYTEMEVNKGRTEYRYVSVSNCLETICKDWVGLKQVIKVHRIVRDNGEQREENAYFISSLQSNALLYYDVIRSHWQIENSLHWVKDVTLGEDDSKIRTQDAPQNISTIKNIALNIFRKNNYTNIAQAKRLVANSIEKLVELII